MGVRIFHSKTRQQHFRVRVGPVVLVTVGIEEQVGSLQDKNSTMADSETCGQIEALAKIFGGPIAACGIWIIKDCDLVGTPWALGRREGDLVPARAKVLVLGDRFKARRIRILQILQDPHASAGIKGDTQWLLNQRFSCDEPRL